jgi:hypothetical protein
MDDDSPSRAKYIRRCLLRGADCSIVLES